MNKLFSLSWKFYNIFFSFLKLHFHFASPAELYPNVIYFMLESLFSNHPIILLFNKNMYIH